MGLFSSPPWDKGAYLLALRRQLERKVKELSLTARMQFLNADQDEIAKKVASKLRIELPTNVPSAEVDDLERDIQALIRDLC